MKQETGPIRRYWNYFKRGKSEINFLLNIYQTIIIIWAGGSITGNAGSLVVFSIIFGVGLFIVSLIIGKYSLTKVDTALPFINPFTQDIVLYRARMATGLYYLAQGNRSDAAEYFEQADKGLDRWINVD